MESTVGVVVPDAGSAAVVDDVSDTAPTPDQAVVFNLKTLIREVAFGKSVTLVQKGSGNWRYINVTLNDEASSDFELSGAT